MKSSISCMKSSWKTTPIKDRTISGLGDQVDELNIQTITGGKKSMRRYKWNIIKRTNLHNRDGRKQNLLNKIIAETARSKEIKALPVWELFTT